MSKSTRNTLIVNLYGGPGIGKSTAAAGIYYALKRHKMNCELVTEYAKEKVWDDHLAALDNQIYVFAKQYHRVNRLLGKVEIIVTDSPILLSCYYAKDRMPGSFKQLVVDVHNSLNNYDVLLTRSHREYKQEGRYQTEQEAKDIDSAVLGLLSKYAKTFKTMAADENTVSKIVQEILELKDGHSL